MRLRFHFNASPQRSAARVLHRRKFFSQDVIEVARKVRFQIESERISAK